MWRKMFSRTTTELSISRENARARPPRIIALTVLSPNGKGDERGKRGQWNREENRHGGPHAAEEDEDHRAGEHESDRAFVDKVIDGIAHEDRLVEDDLGDELLRARRPGGTRPP